MSGQAEFPTDGDLSMETRQLREEYLAECPPQFAKQVVIVTGATRSGTTILGKLVATLKDVELEYEPWLCRVLPMIARAGLIENDFAKKLFVKYVNEVLIARLLGRNVNLRRDDASCILNALTEEELKERWGQPPDRNGVITTAQNRGSILAMKMANLQPHYEFLSQSFTNCKFIHIVRNGLDVALSIMKKGWFTDERLRSEIDSNLNKVVCDRKTGGEYLVPYHIPVSEARKFSEASDFERGLMTWCIVLEKNEAEVARLGLGNRNYLEIKYEDLLKEPVQTVARICSFIGTSDGEHTRRMIKTIESKKLNQAQDYPLNEVKDELIRRSEKLLKRYGYDTNVLKRQAMG